MHFSKNDIIMNILGKTIIFFIFLLFYSCANYETNKSMQKEEKKYYTSTGFALIFDEEFYEWPRECSGEARRAHPGRDPAVLRERPAQRLEVWCHRGSLRHD